MVIIKKKLFYCFVVTIIHTMLNCSFCFADAPELSLPVINASQAPKIDGVINETEWTYAAKNLGLFKHSQKELNSRMVFFWLASDGKNLYIAIKSETAPDNDILARVRPAGDRDRIQVCYDDGIEIWIDPHKGDLTKDQTYYQIIFNSLGAIYDIAFVPQETGYEKKMKWRVDWDYKSSVSEDWWHAEIKIPFSSIGADQTDLNHDWGIRICRNWQRPGNQSSWAQLNAGFADRDTMPVIHWDIQAPLVRHHSIWDQETGSVLMGLEIKNILTTPITVRAYIDMHIASNPPQTIEKLYEIEPGKRFLIELKDPSETGVGRANIKITSKDQKNVYFMRDLCFNVERKKMWTVAADRAQAMLLDIAFYPYHEKLKARLDLNAFDNKSNVKGALLKVADKDGRIIAEQQFPDFKKYLSEIVVDLPDLKEGVYTVKAECFGSGFDTESIERSFERRYFDWEHNTLGLSDEVIPPYTPLTVEKKDVHAVLRKHTMGNTGFWDQVKSEGKDILAGPIAVEVKTGQGQQSIEVLTPISFKKVKGHSVTYSSDWKAGTLEVRVEGEYDYDGMLKIAMNFKMKNESTLENLDLIIPVKADIARFIHVCSDSARIGLHNIIPPEKGLIWKSEDANRHGLKGTFIPYIWLGNARQGICWFADNDKDWLVDDIKSTHELFRLDDQIVLKVHFVTKPASLKREHRIVFGLQATPTKPKITKPFNWRKVVMNNHSSFTDLVNVNFLGSVFYWGGWSYFTFYPRDHDYTIFSLMKKARQNIIDPEEWQAWMDGYDSKDKLYNSYLGHIRNTMGRKLHKYDVLIPYTNPRGIVFDDNFETFQDEWLGYYEYTDRTWDRKNPMGFAYEISPGESYRDYVLWYFQKMLDSGAMDAIYYDNTYTRSLNDTISTSAYIDEQGSLRPSCDIFAMRQLLKRSAVLAYQKRGYNLNMAHMTSTLIVPINTWAGTNLDWEWHYGLSDFQDRFSRAYCQILSTGLQTGCVTAVLGRVGIRGAAKAKEEKLSWVVRTIIGCTVVHEIKDYANTYPEYIEQWKRLYDFGYGEDDCIVYNYWDDNYPLKVTGADTASIVLVRGGKALIMVTDYGDGGECTLSLDTTRMKLRSKGTFYDMARKEKLKALDHNSCSFSLKKHDFITVEYGGTENGK